MAKTNNRFSEGDLKALGLFLHPDGTYSKKRPESMPKERKPRPTHVELIKEVYEESNIKAGESIITIHGIINGLNGSKGLMRGHWSSTKKAKERYCSIIRSHIDNGRAKKHTGQVYIRYVGHKSSLMDWDNFCASFKHIGDSLVETGIIQEDNPKIVVKFIPEQIKCKRENQKVVIIINNI